MKDARFTELVNLYIDRQISPEEAAELELEIQGNPRRRQAYLQYCRMHRATKLVYESFRAHAEQAEKPLRQPATIEHIRSRQRQRRMRWVYGASGLAAAACFAFVFLGGIASSSPESAPVETAASTAPRPQAIATVEPAAQPQVTGAAMPSTVSLPSRDYAALFAALRQEEERMASLQNGLPAPRLNPLFDDGVFDERTSLPSRANQSNRRNPRVQTEFTAFQFQR